MRREWSSASTRFGRRRLDARRGGRGNRAGYRCPACSSAFELSVLDLVSRENSGAAAAPDTDADELLEAMPAVLVDPGYRRLSFRCPGCGGRRAVLYGAAGASLGTTVFQLLWIVEELEG